MIDVLVVRRFGQFGQRTMRHRAVTLPALPPIGAVIKYPGHIFVVHEVWFWVEPEKGVTIRLYGPWEPYEAVGDAEAAGYTHPC